MQHDKVKDIAEQAQQASASIVQSAALMVRPNAQDAAYIGLMTALGALYPTAMMVAKKQDGATPESIKGRVAEMAWDLVNPQTLLFTALLATRTHQYARGSGDESAEICCEFGPSIILETLEAFEQMTGYKADQFLEPRMVEAARKSAESTTVPLKDFLEKRSHAVDSPKAIQ